MLISVATVARRSLCQRRSPGQSGRPCITATQVLAACPVSRGPARGAVFRVPARSCRAWHHRGQWTVRSGLCGGLLEQRLGASRSSQANVPSRSVGGTSVVCSRDTGSRAGRGGFHPPCGSRKPLGYALRAVTAGVGFQAVLGSCPRSRAVAHPAQGQTMTSLVKETRPTS